MFALPLAPKAVEALPPEPVAVPSTTALSGMTMTLEFTERYLRPAAKTLAAQIEADAINQSRLFDPCN
jgi:hypothetical protein